MKRLGLLLALMFLSAGCRGARTPSTASPVGLTPDRETARALATIDDAMLSPEQQQTKKDMLRIAQQKGVAEAFTFLKERWGDRPIQAHLLAHLFGSLVYDQLGAQGLALCDSSFTFGCYHGFLAALIADKGEAGVAIARTGCHDLAHPGDVTACLHGLGHGVMEWKGEIHKAIGFCQSFSNGDDRSHCFDGAFMDNDIDAMQNRETSVSSTQPWQFCADMPEEAKPMCIRNHTFLLISSQVLGLKQLVADCGILSQNLREMCVSSIGMYSADRKGRSAQTTLSICQLFKDQRDASHCITYAVEEFAFEHAEGVAGRLCQTLQGRAQGTCEAALAAKERSFGASDNVVR